MTVTFVESELGREKLFGGDDTFRAFQNKLLENPTCGDVMPKSPNVRKVRFRSTVQSKGSRGGIRVLYRFVPEESRIYLLMAYVKNELENPTERQMRNIKQLAADEVGIAEKQP